MDVFIMFNVFVAMMVHTAFVAAYANIYISFWCLFALGWYILGWKWVKKEEEKEMAMEWFSSTRDDGQPIFHQLMMTKCPLPSKYISSFYFLLQ